MNSEEKTERDLQSIRLLQYIQRFKMEMENTRSRLKAGRIRIEKPVYRERGKRPEVGTGGGAITTSPFSSVRDENAERRLIPKQNAGRTGIDDSRDLEPVDLENLKIRVFSEVFPDDPAVHAYRKGTTLENRFNLLIHVAALENGVTASDYMDLHGLTMDYLCGRLKEMIETKDKQVSARFLAMAFNMKAPQKVTVRKAEQNIYNFGSKGEAVDRVGDKIRELGVEAREAVESLIGEITGVETSEDE